MKKTAKHDKKLQLSAHAIRLLRPARLEQVAGGELCDGGTYTSRTKIPAGGGGPKPI